MRNILLAIASLALFGGAVFAQHAADANATKPERGDLMYLPNEKLLHHFTGGMDTVVADLLWLNCVLFTGQQIRGEHDFSWLQQMTTTVTQLDPHFVDAYRFGGMFLAALQDDADAALELFKAGIVKNPQSWELPYEAAMVWLLNRKDEPGAQVQAAYYLSLAAVHEDCPLTVRDLAAKLQGEHNLTEIEAQMWDKLELSDDDLLHDLAVRKKSEMQIRRNLGTLADLVETYREKTGKPPATLEDLVTAKLIPQIYPDPIGGHYFLSPDHVPLNTTLLDAQRDKSLSNLRHAVQKFTDNTGSPPASLDTLVTSGRIAEIPPHPYPDGSWDYDAATGEVTDHGPYLLSHQPATTH